MLIVTVTYIPYKLEHRQNNNASIRVGEANSKKKGPNFKKLLIVFVTFLCGLIATLIYNIGSIAENKSIYPLYITTVAPTSVLLFFALEADIGKYLLKMLYDLRIILCPSNRVIPLPEPAQVA